MGATYLHQTFDEVAKEYGFDSVTEYMKSDMNPYFSDMGRINYTGVMCEGAAALVFCATDIAKKYQKKPIEVVNVAQCDYSFDFSGTVGDGKLAGTLKFGAIRMVVNGSREV